MSILGGGRSETLTSVSTISKYCSSLTLNSSLVVFLNNFAECLLSILSIVEYPMYC